MRALTVRPNVRHALFAFALAGILVGAMPIRLLAQEDPAPATAPAEKEARTASELLALGDQLAADKKYDEALLRYKDAYEQLVPRVRKRPFKHPVTPRLMKRSEMREYMLKEMKTQISDEELKLMDRSLKAFALVPAEMNVQEVMVNLLTEEVGGFYNPRSKEMFLILEDPRKRSFLSKLFQRPEFDAEEQRTTLAHEMTHALADQHFDLVGLDDLVSGNDDMATAISGLVEGEATLVMMAEMGDEGIQEGELSMSPEEYDAVFTMMSGMMPLLGGRTMRSAPPIFRRTLIFPYHKGTVFVASLTQDGGWEAVDKAFLSPPISTEQILHPEKYLGAERDNPTAVELPQLDEPLAGSGWKNLGENTLGELQIDILLSGQPETQEACEGWDGDRYAVLEHDDGRIGLAWFTTWDSAADARQFAATASQWLVSKHTSFLSRTDPAPEIEEVFELWEDPDLQQLKRTIGERHLVLELRGADVVIVDGLSPELTEQVRERLWSSQKAPISLVRTLPQDKE